MKSVLIYGDSLVHGKVPKEVKRYSYQDNFTGILAEKLGSQYVVIAEGLRARTLSGENGFFNERNGLSQFGPIFGSHLPLDLVCIFLGTNDCNKKDAKSDVEIKQSLQEYKKKIIQWCADLSIEYVPRIMLIAPPIIRGDQVLQDSGMSVIFDETSEKKSVSLKALYRDFCSENSFLFFDAGEFCQTSDGEGVHLDRENNILLAQGLFTKIIQIFD